MLRGSTAVPKIQLNKKVGMLQRDNPENELHQLVKQEKITDADLDTLRLEYFLQSLAEKIEDLPKTWVGRTSKLELTVQQAQEKHYRIMDKRSEFSNICSDSPNHRSCCLNTIEVDLHSLGWTTIIAPRIIHFNYCNGSCDPNMVLPSLFTNAAAQLLYRLHISSPVPINQPCCSPRSFVPLELLFLNTTSSSVGSMGMDFYDIESVVIPDMIVEECGCS
ncbi:growth/differentiation factor 8 [Eurytemora carolleeae]|uniref:growth/differentiation factor 8 n=1 Tax=Eurytemora carolleeae TaxID=1294199 RepID=UPI000C7615DF|nr:growth/differentiation factor 8 [Eurytemora carolleeae]|eukprot:XP_023332025.1 growth/differentiation factor 8-like [Eurytemora affinis]